MNCTGGSYASMPIGNSEAVRRGMMLPSEPLSSQIHSHTEPYPPYATQYGYKKPYLGQGRSISKHI